ncbi:MAG: adenylate kinase [Candidatus Marsarchaeota archaeon]|nr:adenylate kinase [Candidatus Marsarchaeota archaeon]
MLGSRPSDLKTKLIVVAGINGVGKSTVLSMVRDIASQKSVRLEIVNFGTEMLNLAIEKGWTDDRDQLRKMPLERQLWLQSNTAKQLAGKTTHTNVLVDTHVVLPTPYGLWPGLPKWVVENLSPSIIVLLEASPETIAAHRAKDSTRKRSDQTSVEEIKTVIELNRAAALSSAVLVGASVMMIENKEGDPSEAASKIVRLFSQE